MTGEGSPQGIDVNRSSASPKQEISIPKQAIKPSISDEHISTTNGDVLDDLDTPLNTPNSAFDVITSTNPTLEVSAFIEDSLLGEAGEESEIDIPEPPEEIEVKTVFLSPERSGTF